MFHGGIPDEIGAVGFTATLLLTRMQAATMGEVAAGCCPSAGRRCTLPIPAVTVAIDPGSPSAEATSAVRVRGGVDMEQMDLGQLRPTLIEGGSVAVDGRSLSQREAEAEMAAGIALRRIALTLPPVSESRVAMLECAQDYLLLAQFCGAHVGPAGLEGHLEAG